MFYRFFSIFFCIMKKNQQIHVLGILVNVKKMENNDFISLTDIAKRKNTLAPKSVVANWLRLRNTIDYLWLWEFINNPNFNSIEFDAFKNDAGTNAFTLSPQMRIEKTQAIGLISNSGKYWWWTYAHKDIAIKFANRISVEFELYLIKEFQRLKAQETQSLDWNVKRFLTKMNYKIHTDAIKDNLIPKELSQNAINILYADEADVLNLALFGMTAKQWQTKNTWKQGNIRDYATIEQLIILANMESLNAEYIRLKILQSKRLQLLNQTAITQMTSLLNRWTEDKFLN